MTRNVVRALTKYADKLRDVSVDNESKLRILMKLDRVSVELGLISDTGIGRAVKSVSSEPNEIGKLARNLVSKWRNLLKQHIGKTQTPALSTNPSVNNERREFLSEKSPIVSKSLDANKPELCEPSQPPAAKSLKRRSSIPSPSLDSSSGLSFEAALSLSAPVKKKLKRSKLPATSATPSNTNNNEKNSKESDAQNPGQSFTEEILKSLADPFERPDVQPASQRSSEPCTSFVNLDDDGDLKFRSKKVIWAPRINRQNAKAQESLTADVTHRFSPPKLLDLCILALSKNVSIIDHVGLLPYEIMARVLKDASTEDLYRIQKFNPQFRGLTDDLWKKHVFLNFPSESRSIKGPKKGETWFDVYKNLEEENKRRLDRFINRSTQKIKAEEESRRKTLVTDVITPRLRRGNGGGGGGSLSRRFRRSASPPERKVFLTPINMSYPSSSSSNVNRNGSGSNRSSSGGTTCNRPLLKKLRKQFLSGR
nr:hypothetical transcript [Hymenolepis microstoma]